jgi:hypothetical protein
MHSFDANDKTHLPHDEAPSFQLVLHGLDVGASSWKQPMNATRRTYWPTRFGTYLDKSFPEMENPQPSPEDAQEFFPSSVISRSSFARRWPINSMPTMYASGR